MSIAEKFRADGYVWEAFQNKKDEFARFYRSALKALETYKTVLQAHRLIDAKAPLRPKRGDSERMRQDNRALVEERDVCIEAISGFHRKFSAMLTIL